MQSNHKQIPVIAILGPTASGKSSLALKVAQKFNCEIINCDSRQIYREMNIGTAKPSDSDKQAVAHHLFDIISPDKNFSAGDYLSRSKEAIIDIFSRHKVPLLTGGTGFYYNAISVGLPPTAGDETIANGLKLEFEEKGLENLCEKLGRIDPEAHANIDLNNSRRVLRALEIIITSKKPFSANLPVVPLPDAFFLPVIVTRPRKALHQRIELRVQQMIKAGLEQEVMDLLSRYKQTDPGLCSIGYQEWFEYLAGNKTKEKVIDEIIINSRQYAKRQETWFRKRPGGHISDLSLNKTEAEVFSKVGSFLNEIRL